MTQEIQWAPDLPYMDVRKFIAERLRKEPPSHDLDLQVLKFLSKDIREPILPVTSDLDAAILLIPRDWWWHISHLEANIIPTTPVNGAPVSNSQLYDWYGKPIGYSAHCWERQQLPAAVCEAMLKAYYDLPAAFVVEASAKVSNKFRSIMQKHSHKQTLQTRKLIKKRDKKKDRSE